MLSSALPSLMNLYFSFSLPLPNKNEIMSLIHKDKGILCGSYFLDEILIILGHSIIFLIISF